jgi:DNA-binding transcriptional MerR regulator
MNEDPLELDETERAKARQRPLDGIGRLRRARRRAFYSIGEVCSMVGIKSHVLRYWESQFPELSPSKNRSGNRVYQPREIELIALIHRLVHEERYTVEGAKMRLAGMRTTGELEEQSSRALSDAFLRTLPAELQDIYELLDPSTR